MTDQTSWSQLLEPVRADLAGVQHVLEDELGQVSPPLRDVLQLRVGGGKRLRAALVVLSARLLGVPVAPFYTLGAAVETLHAATLIHDDVVDDSPVRRGQAALHTVWPVGATVLAGDYLLALSASLVAGLGQPALLKIFGGALCTICAGEIRQMQPPGDVADPRAEYERSIEAKTATLFAAATQMAAMLAGATETQVAALFTFGRELGMAYQITDDVLDLVADEEELGKAVGSDLRQGLLTLPVLLYLEGAAEDCPVREVLAGQNDEAHVQAALQAILSSGATAAALAEAHACASRARQALLIFPDVPARRTLAALAEYIVARRR